MVLGGFGWFQVVSGGIGWFRVVSCFINNDFSNAKPKGQIVKCLCRFVGFACMYINSVAHCTSYIKSGLSVSP